MSDKHTVETNQQRMEPVDADDRDSTAAVISLAISAKRIADKLDEIEKTLNSIYMDMPSG